MNQNEPSQPETTSINGANLHVTVSGAGEPLLLIHAGVADSRMFKPQLAAFEARYRVIRFDMRGFGRSNLPPGQFSNIADVGGLLDHLGVAQAHMLGVSFGGLVALDFALAHPDRVKSLILGAPSISGEAPSERIRQFWSEEEALLEAGDLAGATEVNLRLWVDGPQRTPEQVDPAVREQVRAMQMHIFQIPVPDDLEELSPEPSAIERLAEVKLPTLIIVGSLDLPEKVASAERLATEIGNARYAVIEGAAHMMNMEKPAEFNQLVLDFLAEHV